MKSLHFGARLCKLYVGANFSQIRIRKEDDNQQYRGNKFPLAVTISCTNFCNLKCTHCQAENYKDKDIPTTRFLGLIDEIAKSGCKKIGFTGGEPLIRNDIGKIIDRCRKRGLYISLVSNGTLVPNRVHELKGLHLLFLSLDGNREVHDSIRGNGNFDKVIAAAKSAVAGGIPVAFLSTLSSMNYKCIDEMASIVNNNRVHWMVGLIQTEFTGNRDQNVDSKRLKEIINKIRKVRYLRTSKKYLNFLVDGMPVNRCFAGIGYCVIDPRGLYTLFSCPIR